MIYLVVVELLVQADKSNEELRAGKWKRVCSHALVVICGVQELGVQERESITLLFLKYLPKLIVSGWLRMWLSALFEGVFIHTSRMIQIDLHMNLRN